MDYRINLVRIQSPQILEFGEESRIMRLPGSRRQRLAAQRDDMMMF